MDGAMGDAMDRSTTAARWRERADHLERLARAIEAAHVMTMHRWVGPDVWDSPRADRCRERLDADIRRLGRATQDLRGIAAALRSRAAAADVASSGVVW